MDVIPRLLEIFEKSLKEIWEFQTTRTTHLKYFFQFSEISNKLLISESGLSPARAFTFGNIYV